MSDLATLPGEDRRGRLYEALHCAVEAVSLFEQFQQAQYLEIGRRVLRSLRAACGDDFPALWAELGLGAPPDWLMAESDKLQARLQAYQAQLAAADAENPQVEPWRGVTQAGEALLALQAGSEHLLDWDAVRRQVASDYNTLGNALDNAGDNAAALAAYERAIALQPDFAMWRRNQTGTLIELGRLDEAAVALAVARHLEPDAPRLAQLEADLAAAQGKEE